MRQLTALVAAALVLLAGSVLAAAPAMAADPPAEYSTIELAKNTPVIDESLRRGEYGKTKSPVNYDHPLVKKAYAVAAEIPHVLDSIFCYCYCSESEYFKHKSLLSCYVDDHAST